MNERQRSEPKPDHRELVFEGIHTWARIRELANAALLIRIGGRDVGELGERPMAALASMLPVDRTVELFIDAREALGPSTDVSAAWAKWLAEHRLAFHRIHMLTGSPFVELTAGFVRKYAALEDRMRIYTEAAVFDAARDAASRRS